MWLPFPTTYIKLITKNYHFPAENETWRSWSLKKRKRKLVKVANSKEIMTFMKYFCLYVLHWVSKFLTVDKVNLAKSRNAPSSH